MTRQEEKEQRRLARIAAEEAARAAYAPTTTGGSMTAQEIKDWATSRGLECGVYSGDQREPMSGITIRDPQFGYRVVLKAESRDGLATAAIYMVGMLRALGVSGV